MFCKTIKLTIVIMLVGLICRLPDSDAQIRNPNKESEKHDVGVDEHVGALLPLDARFVNDDGNEYTLARFFQSDRPVMLSLNYSDCPMMCSLQLENIVAAMREMEMKPGVDFDFISVSIDPQEGSIRARKTKEKYLKLYAPGKQSGDGWHFLTGEQLDIDRLTTAIGFRYEFVRATKDYIHPPVFVMCSPEGRVMRYVHGVDFKSPDKAKELEDALVETGAGKEGSSISRFIYSCFLDRSYSGQYSMNVMKTMRMAGGMTVVILVCALLPFWFTRSKKSSAAEISADTKITTDTKVAGLESAAHDPAQPNGLV